MAASSNARRPGVCAGTAFVSHAYPPYIHQMTASMTATSASDRHEGA